MITKKRHQMEQNLYKIRKQKKMKQMMKQRKRVQYQHYGQDLLFTFSFQCCKILHKQVPI